MEERTHGSVSREETDDTRLLLQILERGRAQVERGEITPIDQVATRLRAKTNIP